MEDVNQSEHHIQPSRLEMGEVISAAWEHLRGVKWAIWAVTIVMILIGAVVSMVLTLLIGFDAKNPPFILRFIIQPIITNFIIAPFYAGAVMVAVKRAREEKITSGMGFNYLHRYFSLGITMLVINFLATLVVTIVNVPAIVLSLGHMKLLLEILAGLFSTIVYSFFLLALPLVADKNMGAFTAMGASVSYVKSSWVKVFGLVLYGYLLLLLAMIPLFIGLLLVNTWVMALGLLILIIAVIWLLPYLIMLQGEIYRRLVG